jgi:hypothetical protein
MEPMPGCSSLTIALAAVIGLPLFADCAGITAIDRGRLQARHDELAQRLAAGTGGDPRTGEQWHRLRHVDTMAELVAELPEERRPQRILYLAAGVHLAPIALCELLPDGSPCFLTYTDADPAIRDRVAAALGELATARVVDDLGSEGGRIRFSIAGHQVSLTVEPVPAGLLPVVEPDWLRQTDLVITHDWSGDPLENLRVVRELLEAIRDGGLADPPLLMIEDLQLHPYPIDLALFSPVARSRGDYGHRGRLEGPGGHLEVERGPALFGGAALLAFNDRWWQTVPIGTLDAVLDVLLFSEFLLERQNVLEGGGDPLLAPALLDWWTGFGARTVAGYDLRGHFDRLLATPALAASALPAMNAESRWLLSCHLQLMRSLAEARAAGADISELMPAARYRRRPIASEFPNPEMARAFRQSLRHAAEFRAAAAAAPAEAARLARVLGSDAMREVHAACPIVLPSSRDDAASSWTDTYRSLASRLRAASRPEGGAAAALPGATNCPTLERPAHHAGAM